MYITAPSVVGLLVRSVYVQYINKPNNKSLTLSFFLFKLPAASRLIKKSVVRSRASISQHTTWMVSPRVVHAGRHLAVSTRPRIKFLKERKKWRTNGEKELLREDVVIENSKKCSIRLAVIGASTWSSSGGVWLILRRCSVSSCRRTVRYHRLLRGDAFELLKQDNI
jgi:hypothetical protein